MLNESESMGSFPMWTTRTVTEPAIDRRTYIATAALQGYTAAKAEGDLEDIAKWSVMRADALIAALDKEPEDEST